MGLLGLFVIVGWMLHNEAMVRIVPGSVALGLNAAILFLASGLCLALFGTTYQTSPIIRVCIWLLILLPSVILTEHLFNTDLGIDWVALHATVKDGNPYPGRVAPNTSLGFLFAGLIFLLFTRIAADKWAQWLATLFVYGTLALGFSGLIGYILNLEVMYRFTAYNRMAASAAFGLSVLGVGLWMLLQKAARSQPQARDPEDKRIIRTATVVLTVLALTAGMMGFATLQQGFEKSLADTALLTAKNNAATIADTLDQRLGLAEVISVRLALQKHLIRLNDNPKDQEALALAGEVGNSFFPVGISGIRLFNVRGDPLLSTGTLVGESAVVTIKLARSGQDALLLWQDGFVLHTKNDIIRAGQVIGKVEIEQRWPALTKLLATIQSVGKSTDVLLCGRDATTAICFPSRFYPANTRIPMFADGQPNFPISRALLGENGALVVKDLRGIDVLAGYTPVADLGLGLVLKVDTEELYAPLRERLHRLVVLLIALVAAGIWALRMQVHPLAMRIVTEQRRMQVILETSHEAFVAMDQQGLITDWNAEAERTFGWSRQEAVGKSVAELIVPPTKRDAHREGIARFLETGHGPVLNQRAELVAMHRSGKEFPVEITISPIKTDDGYVFTAFMHDISDRKQTELKLHHQATCDVLTGLPNRAELMNRLQQAMARADRTKQALALMFLDIDAFKQVNDTYGHEVGDALLKQFARRLQACVRKTDTVARLAGDEFIIIAENVVNGPHDAQTIANKVIFLMAEPLVASNQTMAITTSIGIAVYAAEQESGDELLARADKAMYAAKKNGKNQFTVAGFPAK